MSTTATKEATTPLIYAKIPAIMADAEAITKSRKNVQQGYAFRSIDDLYNSLHGVFAKHGVFFTTRVVNATREERQNRNGGVMIYTMLEVEFTYYAEDGSSVSSVVIGEAADSGDKSCNKALSAAMKYALMQMLLIPTAEERDADYQTHEFKAKETVAEPAELSAHEVLTAQPSIDKSATKVQINLINNLLANASITDAEREKMGKAIPGLTKERAARTIENLMATIAERQQVTELPLAELKKAA